MTRPKTDTKGDKKSKRIFTKIENGKDDLARHYDYDERKFRQSYIYDIDASSVAQLAAKLMFSAHALEKSLSNDNFETNRGLQSVRVLVKVLEVYKRKKFDQSHYAYINTLSVLKEFYKRHEEAKDTDELKAILGRLLSEIESCDSGIGGSKKVYLKDKANNDTKNFRELSDNRFSVRSYSDRPVSREDIRDAIEIAMKAPSVCNRQPFRVYEMYDKEVIEKVLEVQGGIVHYDTPPALLLITVDDGHYVDFNERNQGFIDGGLFAMSVMYALEYKKLAACPLNTMFAETPEMMIRGMLDLSEGEKLITFISVGHFKEENNVCKSVRYPVEYVLSEKNKIYDYTINIVDRQQAEAPAQTNEPFNIRKAVRLRTRLRGIKHKLRLRTRIKEKMAKMQKKLDYLKERRRYSKADGVIITLNGYFNYGNMIQRFALQEFLKQKGYNFVSYEKAPTGVSWDDPKRFSNTRAFVEENIWRKEYDPRDEFSTYIVGSDQVWRNWGYKDEKADLGYFFLDFVDDPQAKRIAYAASTGVETTEGASISPEFVKYAKPLIEKFDAIFMRADFGVDFVRDVWGVKSRRVVDPVMLLTTDDYNKLIGKAPHSLEPTKPLFAYVLATDDNKTKFIETLASTTRMEVSSFYVDQESALPPVEQWLKNFRDAELIVTDSFHGLAFSLINNKPFIILENAAGGEARILGLLKDLDLEDRLVKDDQLAEFDFKKLRTIDWDEVNDKLNILKNRSEFWLMRALEKPKSLKAVRSRIIEFNFRNVFIFMGKARRWTIANIIRYTQPFIPRPIRRVFMRISLIIENRIFKKLFGRKITVANSRYEANKPLVSVISPYYNCSGTIQDTLGSVLNQTFQDFEYIIVDDGSKPSESIALDSIKHPKVRVVHLKNNIGNGSPGAARNVGILMSKGKYVVCLDADDMIEPTYLEKGAVALETHPWLSLFSTNTKAFGEIEETWEYTDYDPKELFTNNMITSAAMFRRSAWEELGGYKEDIGYEDWEMWINMAEHGHFAFRLKEALFNYRTAASSRFVDDRKKHKAIVQRIRELHPRYSANIRLLKHYARRKAFEVDEVSAFVNLSRSDLYKEPRTSKPNVLVAMPWMTFGGAETLIVNFCSEIKDSYNLSFVTGLESKHEWEYKFSNITPNIYHLANLFKDRSMYLAFLSNYITSRDISILHIIHTDFLFDILGDLKERHPNLKVVVTVFNDRVYLEEAIHEASFIDVYTTDNQAVQKRYKNELEKAGREGEVKTIPNGINTADIFTSKKYDRNKKRAELGIGSNDLAIFFIGRLSKEKNPDVFVEAAKKALNSKCKDVKFFVIGDGNMRSKIESQIKKSGHTEHITYLGYQSNVAEYLSAADIFVLPSSTEGFPLSILEAMAMDVVVIASDVGAVADVVESGVDGFVVKPESVNEVKKAIMELSEDRNLLQTMKQRSRKKVETKYSNIVLGRNYKELYREVLK